MLLMAAALAGLRSVCPAPKVTRSPAPVVVAALAALSEIGGGGGAGGAAAGGGGTGARAMVSGGAVGRVAGGACGVDAAGGGDVLPTVGTAVGFSAACCEGGFCALAASVPFSVGRGLGFSVA